MTIEEADEYIIKLTEKWYRYVNLDHHKDRDCHWYITKSYSYGHPAVYRVSHNGYIGNDFESKDIDNELDAMLYLISKLDLQIKQGIKWLKRLLKEYDQDEMVSSSKEELLELLEYMES